MKNTKIDNIVGIDISKETFDVALLKDNKVEDCNKFANNLQGFKKLTLWLKSKNINIDNVLICAEKTGIYSIRISKYLSEKKYKLWLEDGIKISKSEGFKRGKTDKVDAERIAKYAFRFQDNIKLWEPNEEIYDKLAYLFSLRERLVMVLGILEKPLSESKGIFESSFQKLLESICLLSIMGLKTSIKSVDKKMDSILSKSELTNKKYKIASSVRGIGKQTAIYLLIITRGFTKIKTSRACSCFGGMAPFEFSSGTSIKGRTRISSLGNKTLKKLLHMGVMSMLCHKKGEEYKYYLRKVSEGKHKMKVINAVRNKMLARVFACIRDNREYEEEYFKSAS